ncbi:MAG TPA: secretin N-terminal domain-containing protein [Chthoniobacteraceae bacterium]
MSRLTPVLCGLLLGHSAFAQVPLPGAPGQATPPPRTVATPLAGQSDLVSLQFPNLDVRDVLAFYERLRGVTLVIDNAVMGNLTIQPSVPVTRDEAIKIIEVSLLLNGFTLVPGEGKIVKVIGIGKNPRTAAIPLIADELLLPDGEQVVTFLIKLKYADPTELEATLARFVVGAPGGFTNITALPKAGALLITENTATVRQVLRVIREIDIPPAEVLSRFFDLQRADAEDVQKKLEDILTKQNQPASGPAGGPGIARPVTRLTTTPDGQPLPAGATGEVASTTIEVNAGPNEENIIVGKIKITADARTNRIHVVTRPANMRFIAELIAQFDANVKFGNPTTRKLNYVSADDVFEIVKTAIADPGAKDAAGGPATPSTPGGGNRQNNQGQGNNGSVFNDGASGGGNGGSEFNVSEGLSTEPIDTTPKSVTIGNTRIIADKRQNAIIVIGNEDVKQKLFRVIDELDKRAPQVMFHVVIGELNLTDREQFGVDYIIRNAGLGTGPIVLNGGNTPGTGTGTDPGTTPGTGTGTGTTGNTGAPTSLVGFNGTQPTLNLNNLLDQRNVTQIAAAGGSGLSGFFTAGNSLNVIVTALENTNRFRVVSRPSVFTSNLKKAIIASGQEIAVPQNIQSSINSVSPGSNGVVTNSSVQFKRVALQLEVVPLINSDGEVDLDILQKNDEVAGSTRIDNNDIPTIATRYVRTHVTVPNQATLVLGGLIKVSNNRARSGIPLLSNIPLLGYLFSNTTKERVRQELVILIRPEVSWTPSEDVRTREKHQEFFNMPPDLEATVIPQLQRTRTDGKPGVEIRKAIPVKVKPYSKTIHLEQSFEKK